jgi:hypothetical protein
MTGRETTTKRAMMTAAAPVGRERAEPPAPGWRKVLLHAMGLGLLIVAGAIHLDLYLTGYRTIPAISRLLLLQVIAAFGLGLAALAIPGRLAAAGGSRLRPGHPRRLPAVGLDRAGRVHRGPHDRPHRRRPGGGGRFHGLGRRRIVPGTPRLGAAA